MNISVIFPPSSLYPDRAIRNFRTPERILCSLETSIDGFRGPKHGEMFGGIFIDHPSKWAVKLAHIAEYLTGRLGVDEIDETDYWKDLIVYYKT